MAKIVEGTGACPVCGKWNSLVYYTDGTEKWSCLEGCHTLPDLTFGVYTRKDKNVQKGVITDTRFVVTTKTSSDFYDDLKLVGTIQAKNILHAKKIQFAVEEDYRLRRKTKNKAYTPC